MKRDRIKMFAVIDTAGEVWTTHEQRDEAKDVLRRDIRTGFGQGGEIIVLVEEESGT